MGKNTVVCFCVYMLSSTVSTGIPFLLLSLFHSFVHLHNPTSSPHATTLSYSQGGPGLRGEKGDMGNRGPSGPRVS